MRILMEKKNLIGLTKEEMLEEFVQRGFEKYQARQCFQWIYNKGATTFEEMTNISKQMHKILDRIYTIDYGQVKTHQCSTDGTQKWLLSFHDKTEVETVFIPQDKSGTACLSSQVGCSLSCTFCHTGTQALQRNLTAAEIVSQFMIARHHMNEFPLTGDARKISNIVMMGQGEPLYNFKNLVKALKVLLDPEGACLSKQKITVSTSGVVPMIKKLGEELGVNLAVSLHAVNDTLRSSIVPINRYYPIAELMAAVRAYPGLRPSQRVTFEYVMLKGINDHMEHAKELTQLIRGIPCLVNLIPFSPWPGAPYESSSIETVHQFAEVIRKAGFSAPIRYSKGPDIMAACGQLKTSENLKQRKLKEMKIENVEDSSITIQIQAQ